MGRPKKFINSSEYPNHVIEKIARALYDNIISEVSEYIDDVSILSTNDSLENDSIDETFEEQTEI